MAGANLGDGTVSDEDTHGCPAGLSGELAQRSVDGVMVEGLNEADERRSPGGEAGSFLAEPSLAHERHALG